MNNLFDFTYRNGQTFPQKYDSVLYLAITATSKSLICIFNRITVDTIFFPLCLQHRIFDQLVRRARETFGHKTPLIVRASLRDLSS